MRRQSSVARYLLARFRPLGRPVFWAPSIALLLLTLFTWEFWSRPEWMSYFENSPSAIDNSVSREDQAIGAEIDSLSLLMNDIGMTTKVRTTPANPIPQASPAPTNLTPTNRSTPTPPNSLAVNPTQPQANQGIFGVFGNALTAQLGLSNPVNPSATNSQSAISQPGTLNFASTPAPLPASPLQEALTRLNAEKAQTVVNSPAPIEGTTRLNTPTIDATSQANSFTKLVEGTQPIPRSPDFPGTIVPPISTPSIAPTVTPVMAQPTSTQSFGSVAGSAEAPPVEMPVPTINQQPFTVPRPIPGRYIGGGNINTFSNP